MDQRIPHILATATITLVWFVNGFFCKVLNLVLRHQEIVGEYLENNCVPNFLAYNIGFFSFFIRAGMEYELSTSRTLRG